MAKKPNPCDCLEELPEYCDHPKEWVTKTNPDIMGMFFFYCKKCGSEFHNYNFPGYNLKVKNKE